MASETTDSVETPATPAQPVLRVVNPDATPEEIAALVAVFSAMGGAAPAPKKAKAEWNSPHRLVRRTLPHGLGGWRASHAAR
jgi:hypothetical protein